MATAVPPKKNAAYTFFTGLVSQADTKLLKSAPTLAAGDFKVSIDGGAFANLATLPTVTPAAGVAVKISLSAAEMNGDNIVVLCSDAAGAEWCDQLIELQTASKQINDLLSGGAGSVHYTITVKDSSGNPIDGVSVYVTSDAAGNSVVAGTLFTNSAGAVTFQLDPGTYSVWKQRSGYSFTNPSTITVT